jgi:hypothetical protein
VLLNGFQQIFGFFEGVLRSSTQSIERRRLALRSERMGQRQTVRPVQTMDRRWGSLCDCRTEVH